MAPEQTSRTAAYAEAHSQVSHDPFDIRDRQIAFICGGKRRTAIIDSPRERLATEQPRGKLTCPCAATRAKDAALPISRIGSNTQSSQQMRMSCSPLSTTACR